MGSPIAELRSSRECLHDSGPDMPGSVFQERHAEIFDHYFRRCVQESPEGRALFRRGVPFAFLAVGGYGRRELSLHSDIDLVILFQKRIPKEAGRIVNRILYPLWDQGLELGYGIRTVKDCLKLAGSDPEVLTSLMDARFLCGDSPLFLNMVEKLHQKVIRPRAEELVKQLLEKQRKRGRDFGDASHRLEPDLKEGIGGLRDYHHIWWMGKALLDLRVPRDLEYRGILSTTEYEELRGHLEVIWRARLHLHSLSGRANDRLFFEYQEQIAKRLGYRDRKGFPAVEQFLGRLHESMAGIKSLHQAFLQNHVQQAAHGKATERIPGLPSGLTTGERGLSFSAPEEIPAQPFLLMEIFSWTARTGLTPSREAIRIVREFLYLVDDRFRRTPRISHEFLKILTEPHVSVALEQMLETGFLERLIPEFRPIRNRVQFDAYHIYPVGWHSLETVRRLENISRQEDILLPGIFEDLPDPAPLFLGALLHDIGKTGKNHAVRGSRIARAILDRLDADESLKEDVVFLVRNHLLMYETATRRDLNDEKSVVLFASAVADVNRLKMLYLLTWADSMATGPRAWNDWIAGLVQELFFKALHVLERGELATSSAARKMKRAQTAVRKLLGAPAEGEGSGNLFDRMTPRYLLHTHPAEIARHTNMALELRENGDGSSPAGFRLHTRTVPHEKTWELTFLGQDRPGLFSDLTGVLALNDINILTADIYTWRDGTAVDIFRVTGPRDPLHPEEAWEKVRKDIARALEGTLDLANRLRVKSTSELFSRPGRPARAPVVKVDNHSSDFFTLIEVFAPDRIGLLHTISRALFELGVDIRIAKIGTKGDQVADVFYVRDLVGRKIEEPEAIERIERTLIRFLGGHEAQAALPAERSRAG